MPLRRGFRHGFVKISKHFEGAEKPYVDGMHKFIKIFTLFEPTHCGPALPFAVMHAILRSESQEFDFVINRVELHGWIKESSNAL